MKIGITDKLAIERTRLAEERTHLAYIRTGLSLAMGGLFFVGFFEGKQQTYAYVGLACVLFGIVFLIYGFYSHNKTKEILKKILKR